MTSVRLNRDHPGEVAAPDGRMMSGARLGGMLAGTPVLTLEGELPVEYLNVGDRVVTRRGAARITAIAVDLVQGARIVRIAPDTPGISAPRAGVLLSASQGVALSGRRSGTTHPGEPAVIAAARLTDGAHIRAETLPEARLFRLRFAEATLIHAGGLLLACDAAGV